VDKLADVWSVPPTYLAKAMEDYNITADNLCNWEEKGFLIGLAQKLKRIMTKKIYDSGEIKGAKQDGSREFISLLVSICTDGTKIPPAFIYKGKSEDLQNTWLDDLNEKGGAFFASSANGWSSNAFGLAYLIQVLIRVQYTGESRPYGDCLQFEICSASRS
jgi:hypothetical protein